MHQFKNKHHCNKPNINQDTSRNQQLTRARIFPIAVENYQSQDYSSFGNDITRENVSSDKTPHQNMSKTNSVKDFEKKPKRAKPAKDLGSVSKLICRSNSEIRKDEHHLAKKPPRVELARTPSAERKQKNRESVSKLLRHSNSEYKNGKENSKKVEFVKKTSRVGIRRVASPEPRESLSRLICRSNSEILKDMQTTPSIVRDSYVGNMYRQAKRDANIPKHMRSYDDCCLYFKEKQPAKQPINDKETSVKNLPKRNVRKDGRFVARTNTLKREVKY